MSKWLSGNGQRVHVADHAVDAHAERFGAAPPDLLHLGAAVHGVHLEAGLALEQRDAHRVGAGAHVEHPVAFLEVHGVHEAAQQEVPPAQARHDVRLVVIRRDVGEHLVQLLRPDAIEALLAELLAQCDRRRRHGISPYSFSR